MTVTPPKPRHTIEDTGEILRITIRSPKRWPLILSLGVGPVLVDWLGWWSRPQFATNGSSGSLYFVALVTILVSVYSLILFLWLLVGGEVIEANPAGLRMRRQIFGLGWSHSYEGAYIRGLRVAPIAYPATRPNPWRRHHRYLTLEYLGLTGGQIAFEYGTKTIRFGSEIAETEALMIVNAIVQRFHRYQRK